VAIAMHTAWSSPNRRPAPMLFHSLEFAIALFTLGALLVWIRTRSFRRSASPPFNETNLRRPSHLLRYCRRFLTGIRMKLLRRFGAWVAIALAAIILGLGALVAWRAQRALRNSERAFASQESLPCEVRALAPQPNPGFESLRAPAVFRGGAFFEGRFYLSGPAGLFAFAPDGRLAHIDHVGTDLPPSPLGAMAVGTLADSRRPELLIATDGAGVLAFDGASFRQIRPDDAGAREVTALLPLGSGTLLLGTAKRGLLVWDGKALRPFHATTANLYITSLAGNEGDLWIGTLDGLLHWQGGQAERIGEHQGLPDPRVETIAVDGDCAWVGTPAGVAEFRQGRFSRTVAPGAFAHALLADNHSLLVGDFSSGVVRVSLAATPSAALRRSISAPAANFSGEPTPSPIEQFLPVAGHLYAVAVDGLLEQDPDGAWRTVLAGGSALLTDRNIAALMADQSGRLWVGYFDRGLDILPVAGGQPLHIENEHVFCVNRIVEDARDRAVAVATANGLVWFDPDGRQKQVLERAAGLIADHVTDVALYGDGVVAATPAGITFLDSTGPHSMYAFEGLVNNHVYALATDGSQLLVGTLGGLSLVSNGIVRRNLTTANSGLRHNWITGLVRTGDHWLIGTYGAGVLEMDANGSVSATDATRNGVVINPGALLADGRLVLAGTLGQGLLVGDATGTRWRTVTAGLPSLNVTALATSNGTVFVGTENGLVKISESNL
jgi:ligand-binding sensor domain-containing protein